MLTAMMALVAGALIVAPAATPPADAALPVHAPVLDRDFADPDIVKVGTTRRIHPRSTLH